MLMFLNFDPNSVGFATNLPKLKIVTFSHVLMRSGCCLKN